MSKPQVIDARAVVPATPAEVWPDLADGSCWPGWSPLGRDALETAAHHTALTSTEPTNS